MDSFEVHEIGVNMKMCNSCGFENSDSALYCFDCGATMRKASGRASEIRDSASQSPAQVNAREIQEENEIQKLLTAIERNTHAIERNVSATRSIAIFIVGWVGWFIAGSLTILLGGFISLLPNLQILGVLTVLGGALLIIVGAVKAISNSLNELARSRL